MEQTNSMSPRNCASAGKQHHPGPPTKLARPSQLCRNGSLREIQRRLYRVGGACSRPMSLLQLANERLLDSPLSPSAANRNPTIRFRHPSVDLVVSPSVSGDTPSEQNSTAEATGLSDEDGTPEDITNTIYDDTDPNLLDHAGPSNVPQTSGYVAINENPFLNSKHSKIISVLEKGEPDGLKFGKLQNASKCTQFCQSNSIVNTDCDDTPKLTASTKCGGRTEISETTKYSAEQQAITLLQREQTAEQGLNTKTIDTHNMVGETSKLESTSDSDNPSGLLEPTTSAIHNGDSASTIHSMAGTKSSSNLHTHETNSVKHGNRKQPNHPNIAKAIVTKSVKTSALKSFTYRSRTPQSPGRSKPIRSPEIKHKSIKSSRGSSMESNSDVSQSNSSQVNASDDSNQENFSIKHNQKVGRPQSTERHKSSGSKPVAKNKLTDQSSRIRVNSAPNGRLNHNLDANNYQAKNNETSLGNKVSRSQSAKSSAEFEHKRVKWRQHPLNRSETSPSCSSTPNDSVDIEPKNIFVHSREPRSPGHKMLRPQSAISMNLQQPRCRSGPNRLRRSETNPSYNDKRIGVKRNRSQEPLNVRYSDTSTNFTVSVSVNNSVKKTTTKDCPSPSFQRSKDVTRKPDEIIRKSKLSTTSKCCESVSPQSSSENVSAMPEQRSVSAGHSPAHASLSPSNCSQLERRCSHFYHHRNHQQNQHQHHHHHHHHQTVDIHAIFALSAELQERRRRKQAELQRKALELAAAVAAEQQKRQAAAEAAFQNWLAKKNAELRRHKKQVQPRSKSLTAHDDNCTSNLDERNCES